MDSVRERPRILVVEDDPGVHELLCMVLDAEGYAPSSAMNGREALQQLDACGMPALITLDMRMPCMDGWAFLATYAQRPGPRVPVLIVTALVRNGHTLTADVAGLLTKPFALEDLRQRVHALAPLPAS